MKSAFMCVALSLTIRSAEAKQTKHDYDETGGPQSIQATHKDEPGTVTYRGQIGGPTGEHFSLEIGPAHDGKAWFGIYVGTNGCLGDTDGVATVRGDLLEFEDKRADAHCSLTIRRTAAGPIVKENECIFAHGMRCSFDTMGKPLQQIRVSGPAQAPSTVAGNTEWRVGASDKYANASFDASDPGISVYCNSKDKFNGVTITFDKYKGGLLETKVDKDIKYVLEIKSSSGRINLFPGVAYYTPADGGDNWIFTKGTLNSSFLDAFGEEGGSLVWWTDDGHEIASWPLRGAAKTLETMRRVCSL